MTRSVVAALELDRPIKVDGPLLGQRWPTVIDGRDVEVCLPSASWPDWGVARIEAPDCFQGLKVPGEWEDSDARAEWGSAYSMDLDPRAVRTAEVTRVAVCLVSHAEDDAPYDQSTFRLTRDEDWLRGLLPQWAALLTDWVEVLTDQVGSPEARDHQAPRSGDGLWVWVEHEGGWTEPRRTLQVTVRRGLDDSVWGRALDRESFEFALTQAAASRAPAPPLGFLRDARVALLSGQTNRAVLAAGLASEPWDNSLKTCSDGVWHSPRTSKCGS